MDTFLDSLMYNEKGLIPGIIQDAESGRVLTLCYFNREALRKTIEEGVVYLFRRSQNRLMMKGETSGHTQHVKTISPDCENKSLLIQVAQKKAACHEGYFSCYYRKLQKDGTLSIDEEKVFDPKKVY